MSDFTDPDPPRSTDLGTPPRGPDLTPDQGYLSRAQIARLLEHEVHDPTAMSRVYARYLMSFLR